MTACKYWDCGWCYAPNYLKTNSINSACVDPYKCPISPLSEPVQYETPMTEIEKVKAEIKVLEKKLSLLKDLKELEKTKSPVEEAYKDWWGEYPGTEIWTNFDEIRWVGFKAGYNAAYEEKVVEEQEVREWDVVRESMNWCKDHPGQNPLDWVKPQTPEQVADGLKEAFREAVKQGVVSSTKSQTLYDVIYEWWDDHFTFQKDATIHDLVDRIEEWLPKEHDTNSYKWNECIRMIKENLR